MLLAYPGLIFSLSLKVEGKDKSPSNAWKGALFGAFLGMFLAMILLQWNFDASGHYLNTYGKEILTSEGTWAIVEGWAIFSVMLGAIVGAIVGAILAYQYNFHFLTPGATGFKIVFFSPSFLLIATPLALGILGAIVCGAIGYKSEKTNLILRYVALAIAVLAVASLLLR